MKLFQSILFFQYQKISFWLLGTFMIEHNEYINKWILGNHMAIYLTIVQIPFWSTTRIYFWASYHKSEDLDCFQKRFITFTHHFGTLILLHITNCCTIRHLPFVRSEVNCHIVAALKKVFTALRDLQMYFSVTSVYVVEPQI